MAEPQDIQQPNQEQEAILQRAPLLKAFINQPTDISGDWLDKLELEGKSLEKEIATKLGDNWWTTTLGPITLMVLEQDVFDTKLMKIWKKETPDESLIHRIVTSLFLIGYEIGNRKDAFSFIVPLVGKLSQAGLFHYPVPDDETKSYPQRVFNTVWGIVQTGIFIRSSEQKDLPKGLPPQTDPFKGFIESLESIDKLPPKKS